MMIEAATDRDLPRVHSLLERHHLPLDGVDDHVQTMLVAREARRSSARRHWSCTPMVRFSIRRCRCRASKAGISAIS